MSAEIDRFVNDLKVNPSLVDGMKQHAGSLKKVVEYAKSKGYAINHADAEAWLQTRRAPPLSDAELDNATTLKGGVVTNVALVTQAVVATTAAAASQAVAVATVVIT